MEPESTSRETETKEELIERLLAKAELDYKCCGSHCHARPDPGDGGLSDR
jgi:hypothetical protein